MRPTPLVAALLLLAIPQAGAAPERGFSLTGASSITIEGPADLPLLVRLTLENVACARDAEIPVTLSSQAEGARAVLATRTLTFRTGSESALAQAWTGEARTHVTLAPRADHGSVVVRASYQLPVECRAVGGPATGEASHVIRVERQARAQTLPALGVVEPVVPLDAAPAGVHAAMLGTGLMGLVVLVKRLRARQPG